MEAVVDPLVVSSLLSGSDKHPHHIIIHYINYKYDFFNDRNFPYKVIYKQAFEG